MDVDKMKGYLHQYLQVLTQFCGRKKDKLKCAVSLMLTVSLVLSLCASNAFVLAAEAEEPGEKHIHNFTCRELICEEEHDDGEHTEECFAASGPWLCGLEEGQRHIHNQDGYNCWVMAKKLVCEATKSNADRDNGEDEGEALASGSDATGSNAKRLKTGRKHIHDAGCYEEVYECRPGGMEEQIALMSLDGKEFVEIDSWDGFKNAIAENKNIRLIGDIIEKNKEIASEATNPLIIKAGTDISIDLNGYVFNYTYDINTTNRNNYRNLFIVQGSLTIEDNSNVDDAEVFTYIGKDGETQQTNMPAGAIVARKVDNAFFVKDGGTLNIGNGRFTTTSSNRVIFTQGAVNMTGGYIVNNRNGVPKGGGIQVHSTGKLDMQGGVIANNSAENGGGIFAQIDAEDKNYIYIHGDAVITGNVASKNGGGICIQDKRKININNDNQENEDVNKYVVISNNMAERGGAIYGTACSGKIAGRVSVCKNKTNDSNSRAIDVPSTVEIEGGIVQDGSSIGSDLQKQIDDIQNEGELKLDKDYIVSSTVNIKKTITIDLNGHTIAYNGPVSTSNDITMFCVTEAEGTLGNLTITDNGNGGIITSWIPGLNSLVEVNKGCTLAIKGGTFEGSNCFHVVLVKEENSELLMSGGYICNGGRSIKDNKMDLRSGGGILVNDNAKLEMTGGMISECHGLLGGGIYVLNSSEAVIRGGAQINNNTVSRAETGDPKGNGGGICVGNNSTVTIKGSVDISENTAEVNGGGIFVGDTGTVITDEYVTILGNEAKSGGAIYGDTGCTVNLGGFIKIYGNISNDNGRAVNVKGSYTPGKDIMTQDADNALVKLIEALPKDVDNPVLKLEKNHAVFSSISINRPMTIDLNGNTITYVGLNAEQMFLVEKNGHLTIKDTASPESVGMDLIMDQGGADLLNSGSEPENPGKPEKMHMDFSSYKGMIMNEREELESLIKVSDEGSLTLESGTLSNKNGYHAIDAVNKGKVYINGGCITDSGASKSSGISGGGIRLLSGSTLNMSGGIIKGNSASQGGGIAVYDGSIAIIDGDAKVIDNNATFPTALNGGGGGIRVRGESILEIRGNAEVSGNNAQGGGGGIYTADSTVKIEGSAKISYNTADIGGGISIQSTGDNVTINGEDVEISYNTAVADQAIATVNNIDRKYGGGGIYAGNNTNVILEKGVIKKNVSLAHCEAPGNGYHGGGGIFSFGTVTMNGGEVSENKASDTGGGIYSAGDYSNFNMNGGSIQGNVAYQDEAGGLRIDHGGLLTKGEIKGNKSYTEFDWGGGGIFITTGATLKIINLFVNNNTAAGFGGGIGGCSSGDIRIFSLKGATIYGNHAYGTNVTDRDEGLNKRDDYAMVNNPEYSKVFMANGYEDYYCAGTSTVYGSMLGDVYAGWKGSFGNSKRNADGEKIKENGYTVYSEMGAVEIPAKGSWHSDGWMALKATSKNLTDAGTDVKIIGNYSNTHGGGIMSNGTLELGVRTDLPTTGSLQISKTVNGTEKDKEKEFTFEITLTGADIEDEYKCQYTGRDTENKPETIVKNAAGKFEVKLKDGQTVTVFELAENIQYSVTEKEANQNGYTTEASTGNSVSKEGSISGKIMPGEMEEVAFTNTAPDTPDIPGPDPTPGPESGTLTISKLVTGTDEQREFTFTVSLKDEDGNPLEGTFPYNGSKSGEISNGGMVKLSHGESITIFDLPAGTRYHVAEHEANMDGYATIETVVKGDGEIIQSEQESYIRFENHKEQEAPKGSLTIKKTVTGDPDPSNQEFAFAVTLTDPDGNILYGEYPYTGSERNGTFVSGNPVPGIVTLKAGEWITITGLPVGTRYLVMETDESREGYVATPLEKEEVITETNLDPEVEVVNHKIPQSEPGYGTLTVSKAVTGTEERKEFTFTVRLMDGDGNPLPGEFRYDGSKSGMVSDGGQIKLAHGESVTIYDLPENTRYHVAEQEANTDSYVTTVKGDNGIIQSEENAYMDFVNHKEEEPDTPEPEDPTSPGPEDPTPSESERPTPSESEETPATEPDHPTHPDQERPTNPGNPGGGGGGGGRDRDNPTQPAPETPAQPEEVPAEPTGDQPPQPGESSPESQAVPPGETPVVTELPDPNDPNSPDTVILMEDGVPRAYKKVWDPETEEYVYMLDEDIPLAGMEMPKTGDPTRTNMWLILWILSLIGAGISWTARGRRRDRDDRLL